MAPIVAALASSSLPTLTSQFPRRTASATPTRAGALPRPTRSRAAAPSGISTLTRGLFSPRIPHRSAAASRSPPEAIDARISSSGLAPSAASPSLRAARAAIASIVPSQVPRRQRPATPTSSAHPPRDGESGRSRSRRSSPARSDTARARRSESASRSVRSRSGPAPTKSAPNSAVTGPRAATTEMEFAERSGAAKSVAREKATAAPPGPSSPERSGRSHRRVPSSETAPSDPGEASPSSNAARAGGQAIATRSR